MSHCVFTNARLRTIARLGRWSYPCRTQMRQPLPDEKAAMRACSGTCFSAASSASIARDRSRQDQVVAPMRTTNRPSAKSAIACDPRADETDRARKASIRAGASSRPSAYHDPNRAIGKVMKNSPSAPPASSSGHRNRARPRSAPVKRAARATYKSAAEATSNQRHSCLSTLPR